jgi:hypothetical protein
MQVLSPEVRASIISSILSLSNDAGIKYRQQFMNDDLFYCDVKSFCKIFE